MVARRGPTLRGQWLGQQLRERRETAELTLREVAEYLQRDPSTVSRFETGVYPIRRPDLQALLDLYRVSGERERAEFARLSEEVWQRGWWDGYAGDVTGLMVDRLWLDSRTVRIRSILPVVPGLLQTPGYVEALFRADQPDASDEQVGRWVEMRTRRQKEALTRDDPLRLECVLDEAVLRRVVGGPAVMRAQLQRLAEAAGLDQVELRVLPFAAGAHASLSSGFELIELAEPYPDVAYVESQAGTVYLEADGVDELMRRYARLHESALGPEESAALIAAAAEELE